VRLVRNLHLLKGWRFDTIQLVSFGQGSMMADLKNQLAHVLWMGALLVRGKPPSLLCSLISIVLSFITLTRCLMNTGGEP
jgi:hypothetical protein